MEKYESQTLFIKAKCACVDHLERQNNLVLQKGTGPVRFALPDDENTFSCYITGDEGQFTFGQTGILTIEVATLKSLIPPIEQIKNFQLVVIPGEKVADCEVIEISEKLDP